MFYFSSVCKVWSITVPLDVLINSYPRHFTIQPTAAAGRCRVNSTTVRSPASHTVTGKNEKQLRKAAINSVAIAAHCFVTS